MTYEEDHPRTCGEKSIVIKFNNVKKGSPPHMRGKVRESKTGKTRRRITPAHAGKSPPGIDITNER